MLLLSVCWLLLLCSSVVGLSAKYRNLSDRQIRVFWVPPNGNKPVLQARINAGQQISFQTYATHKFWFCEKSGPVKPIDTPGSQGAIAIISDDQLIYPFSDETTRPELFKEMLEELEFMKNYYHTHGRQWLAYYPRDPPVFPMQPAGSIGQIFSVPLTEESTRILCDASEPSCDHPISPEGPGTIELRVLSVKPQSYIIDNFLSDYECDFIIKSARPHLTRSLTVSGAPGGSADESTSVTRTSDSYWLTRGHSNVSEAVTRRLGIMAQIPADVLYQGINSEHINILRYKPGQEYTPHFDWWMSDGPQMRFTTTLLYFNTPEGGGNTSFPVGINEDGSKNIQMKAQKGRALFFYNILPDGNADEYSLHAGEKVRAGEKFVGAFWTWDPQMGGFSRKIPKKKELHSEL